MQCSNVLPYVVDVGFSQGKWVTARWSPKRKAMVYSEIIFYDNTVRPETTATLGKKRYRVKWWKRRAHKNERRAVREALAQGKDHFTGHRIWSSWDVID